MYSNVYPIATIGIGSVAIFSAMIAMVLISVTVLVMVVVMSVMTMFRFRSLSVSIVMKQAFLFVLKRLLWPQHCNPTAVFFRNFKPFIVLNVSANFGYFGFTLCCMKYVACELGRHLLFFVFFTVFPSYNFISFS